MHRFILCLIMVAVVRSAPAAEPVKKMTLEQARARLTRLKGRELPAFWIGHVKDLPERWASLKIGKIRRIATSPGGRPVHLITYGEREPVRHDANFNSAIGARKPSAYMNKAARTKPVVYFVGPVHGHEVEGLTGLVNLIHIMETGKDLRGRDQAALRELGRKCRLLIVPTGNPDGVARFEPRAAKGLTKEEGSFWAMGTREDHTIMYWPESKAHHPRTKANTGFFGAYFNDAGVNPMHDEFLDPMSTEAPAILRVAKEEGPDLAVSLHSYSSAPAILRPAYLPLERQAEVRELSNRYVELLESNDLPHGPVFKPSPEQGKCPAPFNLTSALYHISGAAALTHECPHGHAYDNYCDVSFEQILDMQLLLYEAMMRHGLAKKTAGK